MKMRLTQIFILLVMVIIMIFISGCGESERQAANNRIRDAMYKITVQAGGTSWRLDDFIDNRIRQPGHFFSEGITLYIDFERILVDVERYDFQTANRGFPEFREQLYRYITVIFRVTDNLIIEERGVPHLRENYVAMGVSLSEIAVGRFLTSHNEHLTIRTYYGQIDVSAQYFLGSTVFNVEDTSNFNRNFILGFNHESRDEGHIINLEITNRQNNDANTPIRMENSGKSASIAIPLDADFMKDPNDNIYNMVMFIDEMGNEIDRLPRSFVTDEFLMLYFNRTGSFRLIYVPGDDANDKAGFLKNRGINIQTMTRGNQQVVSRGEFYYALMQIHWAEELDFDLSVDNFTDIHYRDRKGVRIHIGRNLKVKIDGYDDYIQVLQGFPGELNERFEMEEPLLRSQLFRMLAGNIAFFGFNVERLMPSANAIDIPDHRNRDLYWHNSFWFLDSIGFIPIQEINGEFHVNPNGYVTLEEAQEILFKLITTHHFIRR